MHKHFFKTILINFFNNSTSILYLDKLNKMILYDQPLWRYSERARPCLDQLKNKVSLFSRLIHVFLGRPQLFLAKVFKTSSPRRSQAYQYLHDSNVILNVVFPT